MSASNHRAAAADQRDDSSATPRRNGQTQTIGIQTLRRLRLRGARAPVVDCAYGCEKEKQEEADEIK